MRTDSSTQSGKRKSRKASTPDAVALLRQDHKKVLDMFKEFEGMEENGSRKAALVRQICDELLVHTTIEEEIFYPAVRMAIEEDQLMDEAVIEHDSAKTLIDQLHGMEPGDERYDATVTVLGEYIRHHVDEEHKEMFPKAKKARIDLKHLGEELAVRKQELTRQAQAQQAEHA
jgi:hemerythrin superfamily protein